MKSIIKKSAILIIISLLSINLSFAQDPPPPPPAHNSNGNVPGGGAPIGGGLFILLGLGAVYGGKKVYDYRKKKNILN